MLGLPYPGGPEVERAARDGDPKRFAFPRPMLGRPDANFSLSGLKTAVRNEASRMGALEPQDISDLCAGFQAAVLESTADRLSVGLRLFHEQFGPPPGAGRRRRRRRQSGDPRRIAGCRRESADHADHSAARIVHRQRRDDRLGRRRAAGARHDRHHGRAAPRAMAARRKRRCAGGVRQHPRGILAMRDNDEARACSHLAPLAGSIWSASALSRSSLRTQGSITPGLKIERRPPPQSRNETPRRMGPCLRGDDSWRRLWLRLSHAVIQLRRGDRGRRVGHGAGWRRRAGRSRCLALCARCGTCGTHHLGT